MPSKRATPEQVIEWLLIAEKVVPKLLDGSLPALEQFIFRARFTLRRAENQDALDTVSASESLEDVNRNSLPGACIALSSSGGVRASLVYMPDATEQEFAFCSRVLQSTVAATFAALGIDMSSLMGPQSTDSSDKL